jgi:hypothetical protein
VAYEFYPLQKEEILGNGWEWFEKEARNYEITLKTENIPDNIKDAQDSILKETIECAHAANPQTGGCNDGCTSAFRLIPPELALYRQLGVPLPRLCPSCRHARRIRTRNPFTLWKRKCQCVGAKLQASNSKSQTNSNSQYQNTATHFHGDAPCPNEFETSYAPERPETVYCEQCYNAEVF